MEQEPTNVPGTTGHTGKKKLNVPRADIDLGSLCQLVGQNWKKCKWMTLQWMSVDEFTNSVAIYNGLLTDKTVQGSTRPQITRYLHQLDKKIDNSIEYIKAYLINKYSKTEAHAYYEAFGIIRHGNGFIIPKHRNTRQESLAQMLKGIAVEGFTKNAYGQAFWADVKNKFDGYVAQAKQMDSGVSEKTGNKNVLKKDLQRVLNAIIMMLKANHPFTWKTELRNWSFQKEKY